MDTRLELLLFIGLNVLSLYTLCQALAIFFQKEKQYAAVTIYGLYILIGVLSCYIKAAPDLGFVIRSILTMLVAVLFKGRLRRKLLFALVWTVLAMLGEFWAMVLYSKIKGRALQAVMSTAARHLVVPVISLTIMLFLTKLLQLHISRRCSKYATRLNVIQVILIPIFSLFILYSLFETCVVEKMIRWAVALDVFLVFFMNILFYYLLERVRYINQLRYENEFLKHQSEGFLTMERQSKAAFENIRMIRHDLKHHLLYIQSKLEDGSSYSLTQAKKKIDTLTEGLASNVPRCYTKNDSINRLLSYKLPRAYQKGIEVHLRLSVQEQLCVDEDGLYVILGNVLDNAIDNFDNSGLPQEGLNIHLLELHENLYIKVTNPYKGKMYFHNNLPLTRKKDTFAHGIGLKSIQKLIKAQNGYLKVSASEQIFTVEILLYGDAGKQEKVHI